MEGYYRFPAVYKQQVVFVADEDLWSVPLDGGVARRLTNGRHTFCRPVFSPDGKYLAVVASEEGEAAISILPSQGGELTRLGLSGGDYKAPSTNRVCAWIGEEIFYVTYGSHPHMMPELFKIHVKTQQIDRINLGPTTFASFSKHGVILERSQRRNEPSFWKGYKGGTAGRPWIAKSLDHEFTKLTPCGDAQVHSPLWVGNRIYFVSDPDGHGQIYSCDMKGGSLKQHTHLKIFYPRNPSTDGKTLVYHSQGELFSMNLSNHRVKKIPIEFLSQKIQQTRKLFRVEDYLENIELDKAGDNLYLTTRGRVLKLAPFSGPYINSNPQGKGRHRLGKSLGAGGSIRVEFSGEEEVLVYRFPNENKDQLWRLGEWGRVQNYGVSPDGMMIWAINHKSEIWYFDLKKKIKHQLSSRPWGPSRGVAWSPDSQYIAFAHSSGEDVPMHPRLSLYSIKEKKIRDLTSGEFNDSCPQFDPSGQYLYFLSDRELSLYQDELRFNKAFLKTTKPMMILLRANAFHPFVGDGLAKNDKLFLPKEKKNGPKEKEKKVEKTRVVIDWEGIKERVVALPLAASHFVDIQALPQNKVMLVSGELKSIQDHSWIDTRTHFPWKLEIFDLKFQELTSFAQQINFYTFSGDGKKILFQDKKGLRIADADRPLDPKDVGPDRKLGRVNFKAMELFVDPKFEWRQIFDEVWKLQKEHFWEEKIGGVKWDQVYKHYRPVVDRISTREELNDLIWEMHGELGIGHAYIMMGDLRSGPRTIRGHLGAEIKSVKEGYKVLDIMRGDTWGAEGQGLNAPGAGIKVGDVMTHINGLSLKDYSPEEILIHEGGKEIEVKYLRGKKSMTTIIKTLQGLDELIGLSYRNWANKNKAQVEKISKGKVGYIHIPDMSTDGYVEFFRSLLAQLHKQALIIDFRFNGGGNVSQLLLEVLSRKRFGHDVSRWFKTWPVPTESPTPVMVGITNEHAGSDGDIGSHTFKLRKLGPLIGTRTWGGVTGIWPRHRLIDGGIATQPEFAHFFYDVGYDVENYGTDPDIEVENPPHAEMRGQDPQLDRAIQEVMKLLKEFAESKDQKELPDRLKNLPMRGRW